MASHRGDGGTEVVVSVEAFGAVADTCWPLANFSCVYGSSLALEKGSVGV